MSIFMGKSALRHSFKELSSAELIGATNKATAKLWFCLNTAGRMNFMMNDTDAKLVVYLVHPDADSTIEANRLLWIKIPPDRVINYDIVSAPGLEFPPGMKMFVSYEGAAPTKGTIAVAMWG